jgi:hypothetical protein
LRFAHAMQRRGRRLLRGHDRPLLLLLAAPSAVCGVIAARFPDTVPPSALVIPVILGGLLLRLRRLAVLVAVVAAALTAVVAVGRADEGWPGFVVLLVVATAVAVGISRDWTRIGVRRSVGASILVDLRDRLQAQGQLPALPAGWDADVAMRPAGGASFSGDFLVAAALGDECRRLELGLIDVAGKGVEAGSRALQLSGAFGSLLGSVPDDDFLAAANSYLIRQGWPEGFATAAHLILDFATGDFVLRSAGHPPALQFAAGSGTWDLISAEGPALGVVKEAKFLGAHGHLGPGDALMLYTDGLIEDRTRDLSQGIDRLTGAAERLIPRGFKSGAARLVNAVEDGSSDDRALVLLWRAAAA